MKKNKNLGLWLSLLVILIIFTLPISSIAKFVLVALLLGSFLFWKRSIFWYMQANKHVVKPDSNEWEKAWPLYQKAIRNGLPSGFVITAASMYLQRGDYSVGKKLIEDYLQKSEKNKDVNLVNISKTMVSMSYWMDGDLDKAIQTVKEVYDSGYRDKNLFINYGTYALEKGDLETARKLIKEGKELEKSSPGIFDNRGWLMILEGKWEEAQGLYHELVGKSPRFPEPFVHAAQVKVHYGRVGEAIELLERATNARFSNTSGMKRETLLQLKEYLENPETRRAAALAIDKNPKMVASGKFPPKTQQSFEREEGDFLSGFAKEIEKPILVEDEEGERLPNTELTDDDIAYAKKHNLE